MLFEEWMREKVVDKIPRIVLHERMDVYKLVSLMSGNLEEIQTIDKYGSPVEHQLQLFTIFSVIGQSLISYLLNNRINYSQWRDLLIGEMEEISLPVGKLHTFLIHPRAPNYHSIIVDEQGKMTSSSLCAKDYRYIIRKRTITDIASFDMYRLENNDDRRMKKDMKITMSKSVTESGEYEYLFSIRIVSGGVKLSMNAQEFYMILKMMAPSTLTIENYNQPSFSFNYNFHDMRLFENTLLI